MKVKAPNGLILDVPDSIASALVGSVNHPEWEYVDAPPKQENLGQPGAPKLYAPKPDWVEYAVSRGVPREEAESSSKRELIDRLR